MKTQEGAGGPAAPVAAPANDLPDWLTKLPGVDIEKVRGDKDLMENIRGGWLRQEDYTKKTQEVAGLRKLKDRLGDEDPDRAVDELTQWRNWRQNSYPNIEQRLARLDELEKQGKSNDRSGAPAPAREGGYKLDVGDLYEQDRLNQAVNGLEDHLMSKADARRTEWWEKNELPRIDRQAQHYVNSVLSIMEVIWPKEMAEKGVTIKRLLKEAAVTQNGDYAKLATEIMAGAAGGEKDAYQKGYEQAIKEAGEKAKAAGGPPAPPAIGMPNWRKPPGVNGAGKQDRGSMFNEVLREVGSRHGALPV